MTDGSEIKIGDVVRRKLDNDGKHYVVLDTCTYVKKYPSGPTFEFPGLWLTPSDFPLLGDSRFHCHRAECELVTREEKAEIAALKSELREANASLDREFTKNAELARKIKRLQAALRKAAK